MKYELQLALSIEDSGNRIHYSVADGDGHIYSGVMNCASEQTSTEILTYFAAAFPSIILADLAECRDEVLNIRETKHEYLENYE